MPAKVLRALADAVGATVVIQLRWRGGELDRLLDERHAAVVGAVTALLRVPGWSVAVEVTYSRYGERGSIDVLGWHELTRTLLVVEAKSELTSVEETLRRLDAKRRLAPVVARERFGWRPAGTSCLLALEDSRTNRRRVQRAHNVLDVALPARAWTVRGWLGAPSGALAGLLMVSSTHGERVARSSDRHRRVRVPTVASLPSVASTKNGSGARPQPSLKGRCHREGRSARAASVDGPAYEADSRYDAPRA
jgi:hypothetical protein